MGTRSITVVANEDGATLLAMYRQMDGYPSGHGQELVDFLDEMQIVNGISLSESGKTANGMCCLAAQMVAHFKKGVGDFYLVPADDSTGGVNYIYKLMPVTKKADFYVGRADELRLVVLKWGEEIFDGAVAEFGADLKDNKFD